jgi:exodeoxyribonuclease VII large subunit
MCCITALFKLAVKMEGQIMPPVDSTAEVELSVSDFVALHNQILEYALPNVTIVGELLNFRVSKNRWVYFDLKDDTASVRFFGTICSLSGPLEDGMLLKVRGVPKLHPLYGFSINVLNIQPAGEGAIRKAFDLLQAKLTSEGLFDPARKRALPYPPERVGIITSSESAAYADFMKIISARWSGMEVVLADVQVQGEAAPEQIVQAIADMNSLPEPPDVLVITRGGGSSDDLWAFSTEQVTRAVAASRVPTLVAIGHEIDLSLAELAADQRASTPSNAAELLTPDRREVLRSLKVAESSLIQFLTGQIKRAKLQIEHRAEQLHGLPLQNLKHARNRLQSATQILELVSPQAILKRGYAIVRDEQGRVVRTVTVAAALGRLELEFADGTIETNVEQS